MEKQEVIDFIKENLNISIEMERYGSMIDDPVSQIAISPSLKDPETGNVTVISSETAS